MSKKNIDLSDFTPDTSDFTPDDRPDFAANPPGINPPGVPQQLQGKEDQRLWSPSDNREEFANNAGKFFRMASYALPGAIANRIPQLLGSKILTTGARAAVEGLGTGAMMKYDDASNKDAAIGGGIAAAGPVIGALASPAAKFIKNSAIKQYSQVFNPTREDTKQMTKRVVPQLLEQGKVALTRDGLARTASKNMSDIGQKIDAAYQARGNPVINSQPIIDKLDELQRSFTVNGVPFNENAVNAVGRVTNSIAALGKNPHLDDVVAARRILDSAVADARGHYKAVSDSTLLSAQKEGANAIRSELAKQHPDIDVLNKKFNLWSNVYDVLDATATRKVGQWGKIRSVITAATVGGSSYAHGGGLVQAATAAGVTAALTEAVNSPAWRTTSAVIKNQIANGLMSGNFPQTMALISSVVGGNSKRK